MTMTETSVSSPDIKTHPDIVPIDTTPAPIPTRKQVIKAIRRETGCSSNEAASLIDFWTRIRDRGREQIRGYRHTVTGREMDVVHDVLDQMMPDDTRSTPGSAHEMLEHHLLDPTLGEMALLHTTREHDDACGADVIAQIS